MVSDLGLLETKFEIFKEHFDKSLYSVSNQLDIHFAGFQEFFALVRRNQKLDEEQKNTFKISCRIRKAMFNFLKSNIKITLKCTVLFAGLWRHPDVHIGARNSTDITHCTSNICGIYSHILTIQFILSRFDVCEMFRSTMSTFVNSLVCVRSPLAGRNANTSRELFIIYVRRFSDKSFIVGLSKISTCKQFAFTTAPAPFPILYSCSLFFRHSGAE